MTMYQDENMLTQTTCCTHGRNAFVFSDNHRLFTKSMDLSEFIALFSLYSATKQ